MAWENPSNWLIKTYLSDVLGNTLLGQQLAASSIPVVLAVDTAFQVNGGNITANGSFQPIPGTTGGLTKSRVLVASGHTGILISSGVHQLYHWSGWSISSVPVFAKLYDKATAPVVTSDTPVWEGIIPGPGTGAGFIEDIAMGLPFALGIGLAVTLGYADNDVTDVSASQIIINLGYK
jgi:hypothetical protein